MKEKIFDLLIYLFENYSDLENTPDSDPDAIRTELLQAGFPQREVNQAFEWLESLANDTEIQASPGTFRILSSHERSMLDIECQSLLQFLEQNSILSASMREIALDRIMALNEDEITVENLQWIILVILSNRPNEESAFSRMEDLVYDTHPIHVH